MSAPCSSVDEETSIQNGNMEHPDLHRPATEARREERD